MSINDPNQPGVHGTSKITPVAKRKGVAWLPWLIGALILLALLLFLLRSCSHNTATIVTNTTEQTTVTNTASASTPPVAIEQVTLPDGKTVGLEPKTLNYDLQRYLASSAPTPQTFTFDRLNFATGSAALPSDAQATVGALAQILSAYPKATVQLNGYADSTGTDPMNVKLGADRADAVAKALAAQGVSADRIKTATGGSSKPIDTNATTQGRAENRRTELTVVAK